MYLHTQTITKAKIAVLKWMHHDDHHTDSDFYKRKLDHVM